MLPTLLYYLDYKLQAIDAHSIHSPNLYHLYQALNERNPKPQHQAIEELRKALLNDSSVLEIQDYGAGSKSKPKEERSISAIAKTSLITADWGRKLSQLITYIQPNQVVELGTCLGVGTLYIASGLPADTPIYTFEGASNLAYQSQLHFKDLAAQAVQIIEGNIDETLAVFLKNNQDVEFFYVDANHTYEATLYYFRLIIAHSPAHAVIVFDDIHWSSGMHKAWQEIIASPEVGLSIDMFRIGLIFKESPTGEKTHQVWEF